MFAGYAKEFLAMDEVDCESLMVQLQVSTLSILNNKNSPEDQSIQSHYSSERGSWKLTIDTLKILIEKAGLSEQVIMLEYCFPRADIHADPPRADVLILGKNKQGKDRIFIIEMKGWKTNIISESDTGHDLLYVKLGGKIESKEHPSGQVEHYMEALRELQFAHLVSHERISIEAAAYLPNITEWPDDPKVSTALFNSRSIEHAKLYTGITEHLLVAKLQECVSHGSGNDILSKMEKMSRKRKDELGI
jgi:hypothetical protein